MNSIDNTQNGRYRQLQISVSNIQGFLIDACIAVWDAFMCYQKANGVCGHLGEIGVFQGKSAAILAHHQQEEEELWLVDFSDFIHAAESNLTPLAQHKIHYVKQKSVDLYRSQELLQRRRTFRWLHIDGEHTAQAVTTDLTLAHELLADDGIICIDDFFSPAYPQITAATFSFLEAKRYDLTFFACGYNKGYLARPTYVRHYMQMIRSSLASELHDRGVSDFTLWKTSPSQDYDCWGIGFRQGDRDYRGLDSNPDEIC